MNWFDAGIIIVLLIFIGFGIKKGFMFSVIDVFSITVNFIIALFLSSPIKSLLNLAGMQSSIASSLFDKYSSMGSAFTTDLIDYQSKYGNVTNFVNEAFDSSSLTNFGKKLFNGSINNNLTTKLAESTNTSVTLADIMSKSVAQFITVVASFIIAFLIICIILLILKKVSSKLKESKAVNVFDKIFGAIFGLVKGFLFCVAVFAVLSFFSDNGILSTVINYINESAIGGWLRTNVNTFMIEYIDIKQFIIDLLNKI